MKTTKLAAIASALLGLGAVSGTAAAFDVNNCGTTGIGSSGTVCPWVQYGDGISYNLAVNSSLYDKTNGGGTGPGNPFYVDSTPGAIKDLTVLGTGASGTPVNTNMPGIDNAYPTPNDVQGNVFFTTNKTAYPAFPVNTTSPISNPADPGGAGQFAGDSADTWDATITALKSFLGKDSQGKQTVPIFFFNNNQTNSGTAADQNLAIWARITLTGSASGKADAIFDFTNRSLGGDNGPNAPGTFFHNPLGGGTLLGDPTTFSTTSPAGPLAGSNDATDYVLAGGQTCFNPTTGQLSLPVNGSCPAGSETVNNNLGANQAAYAVLFPEMNNLFLNGDYTTMQVDFRMGCDPNTIGWDPANPAASPNCLARSLNNGYEQIFLTAFSAETGKTVPEPATLALMGMGLAGLGLSRRRRVAAA